MEKGKDHGIAHCPDVISQNIRKLRSTMSQADFAKKVGISRATVHRIESRRNFQVESFLKIADSFGLLPYNLCLSDVESSRVVSGTSGLVESFKETLKKEIIAELRKS